MLSESTESVQALFRVRGRPLTMLREHLKFWHLALPAKNRKRTVAKRRTERYYAEVLLPLTPFEECFAWQNLWTAWSHDDTRWSESRFGTVPESALCTTRSMLIANKLGGMAGLLNCLSCVVRYEHIEKCPVTPAVHTLAGTQNSSFVFERQRAYFKCLSSFVNSIFRRKQRANVCSWCSSQTVSPNPKFRGSKDRERVQIYLNVSTSSWRARMHSDCRLVPISPTFPGWPNVWATGWPLHLMRFPHYPRNPKLHVSNKFASLNLTKKRIDVSWLPTCIDMTVLTSFRKELRGERAWHSQCRFLSEDNKEILHCNVSYLSCSVRHEYTKFLNHFHIQDNLPK